MFSAAKVTQVQLISSSHASLLSWSVSPTLARPDVMNNSRVAQLTADINTVLTRPDYNRISYGATGAVPGGPKEQGSILRNSLSANFLHRITSKISSKNINKIYLTVMGTILGFSGS
jgi:hypothetical protein